MQKNKSNYNLILNHCIYPFYHGTIFIVQIIFVTMAISVSMILFILLNILDTLSLKKKIDIFNKRSSKHFHEESMK